MDNFKFSSKHVAINKANAQIVAVVGVASFIVVFCLIATNAVFGQYKYQSRVISKARTADKQLKANISSYGSLLNSYQGFVSKNPNIIGGQVTGVSNDNAHVILDALPGEYDFPGLTSTIANILNQSGLQITSLTGQDLTGTQPTSTSAATNIPFGFGVKNATYLSAQQLVNTLQLSIRPIAIDTLNIQASKGNVTLTVAAHTYYLPSKTLTITKETVK